MAASLFPPTSRAVRTSTCQSCLLRLSRNTLRYSTTDAAPPLLTKMKQDMKAAMRAKDTARLNVLRSIISETNQLASGPTPVKSDLQILAMLKKRKAASLNAVQEAEQANRSDLKEKQEKEIGVLDEYAGSVELVSVAELKEAVKSVIAKLGEAGKQQGRVMKELLQPGGVLDGKPVDKAQLAGVVKESLGN